MCELCCRSLYSGDFLPLAELSKLEQPIPEPSGALDLAIVVAAVESDRSIVRCLDAIARECADQAIEVIVVAAEGDDVVERALIGRNHMRLFHAGTDALTPHMWSEGIAQSSARAFALLTGHCFVTPGWTSSMVSALTDSAAVGGPMRLAVDANLVDAAIFFLRYSAYLDETSAESVRDIAGDNAAYVRNRVPEGSWSRESGFWEHDVNRELVNKGERIAWSGSAIAEFGHSFTLGSICHHRYEHGRLFGISRVERGESRIRIVAGFLVVPFVLALRSWKRISSISRYRGKFLRSMPLMFLIAFCWAFGEAAGALEAGHADRS